MTAKRMIQIQVRVEVAGVHLSNDMGVYTIEVDPDSTDEEIEAEAKDEFHDKVTWNWSKV